MAVISPQLITADTKIRSNCGIRVSVLNDQGAYIIERDGITLDLGDVPVDSMGPTFPDEFVGRCIVVKRARNVTIKKAKISGFKVAIYAEDAPGLTIENCDVSENYRQRLKSTPEKEEESDWLYGHENDNNEWLRYGAGIYLLRCDGATVRNCRARNGQNGICLVRCNDATVVGNDMSFMSGWGLAMWRSSRCKVIGNRFDYCVRGYSHGVYARGQDSTGILVYEQCSDNVFAYNHATHGGDGFFLYAGNETVNKTGEGGCNRNLVYKNDFSYAVANGIEATFSDQNIVVENKLNQCVHGVWAGYSSRSLITGNEILKCNHGISIEHGRHNEILANNIGDCEKGVWLWWDNDKDLLASPYAEMQGAGCVSERVTRNVIDRCKTGVRLVNAKAVDLVYNNIRNCNIVLSVEGETSFASLFTNILHGEEIRNSTDDEVVGKDNDLSNGLRQAGTFSWQRRIDYVDLPNIAKPLSWSKLKEKENSALDTKPPDRMGTTLLSLMPGIPEGKEHIIMTEWGPWDFTGERPRRSATTQPAVDR